MSQLNQVDVPVETSQSKLWFLGACPSSHPGELARLLVKNTLRLFGFSIILSKGEIRVYFNGGNQSLKLTAKNKGSVELFSE